MLVHTMLLYNEQKPVSLQKSQLSGVGFFSQLQLQRLNDSFKMCPCYGMVISWPLLILFLELECRDLNHCHTKIPYLCQVWYNGQKI